MRARSVLITLAAMVAACGQDDSPQVACETPTGCVRGGRVGGTCGCLEWQVVSIEPVPVKFVVVGISYGTIGNKSSVTYGFTPSSMVLDLPFPPSASDLGARWRSVIRARDGSESVATVGPGHLDTGPYGTWNHLVPVTSTSAAFTEGTNAAVAFSTPLDVMSPETHVFFVWINPAAAVVTDYAGGKSVSWSWTAACSRPGGCIGPTVQTVEAGMLTGSIIPTPFAQAVIDAFDPADRAAILAHDPYFDPPGRDPATIAADPRFRHLGTAKVGPASASTPSTAWIPCTGPLTDGAFLPFTSVERPFGAGETLVLQHALLSTSPTCTLQQPGLHLGTSTPGCEMVADLYVDTMFGTLLTVPSSVGASCTRD
jgi:hypothetical protein